MRCGVGYNVRQGKAGRESGNISTNSKLWSSGLTARNAWTVISPNQVFTHATRAAAITPRAQNCSGLEQVLTYNPQTWATSSKGKNMLSLTSITCIKARAAAHAQPVLSKFQSSHIKNFRALSRFLTGRCVALFTFPSNKDCLQATRFRAQLAGACTCLTKLLYLVIVALNRTLLWASFHIFSIIFNYSII